MFFYIYKAQRPCLKNQTKRNNINDSLHTTTTTTTIKPFTVEAILRKKANQEVALCDRLSSTPLSCTGQISMDLHENREANERV